MPRFARVVLGLAAILGAVGVAAPDAAQRAEGVAIEHQGVSCVVAEQFPRFEARLSPAAKVARARLRFRPDGGEHWYSVALTSGSAPGAGAAEGTFLGVLPRPKKSLKRLHYYIEAVGTAGESSRTEEFSPTVVAGPGACQDARVAAGLASASVLVELPAGAPGLAAVPAGFSSAGVVSPTAASVAAGGAAAGGGGIGSTTLVLGGLAVAGGAAGLAVAAGGDGESTSLTGHWVGTLTEGTGWWCRQEHAFEMDLVQTGQAVTGQIALTVAMDINGPDPDWPASTTCVPIGTLSRGDMSSGSLSGDAVSLPFTVESFYRGVLTLHGTASGDRRTMSGSATLSRLSGTVGTWNATRHDR